MEKCLKNFLLIIKFCNLATSQRNSRIYFYMDLKATYYLKIFLSATLPLGLSMLISATLPGEGDIRSNIILKMLILIAGGTLISFLMLNIQRRALVALGLARPAIKDLTPFQEGIITTTLSPVQLSDKLQNSSFLSGEKITITCNRIKIRTKWGDESGGEVIEIIPLDEKSYKVTSRPGYFFVAVDGGRNYKNILRIQSLFSEDQKSLAH